MKQNKSVCLSNCSGLGHLLFLAFLLFPASFLSYTSPNSTTQRNRVFFFTIKTTTRCRISISALDACNFFFNHRFLLSNNQPKSPKVSRWWSKRVTTNWSSGKSFLHRKLSWKNKSDRQLLSDFWYLLCLDTAGKRARFRFDRHVNSLDFALKRAGKPQADQIKNILWIK